MQMGLQGLYLPLGLYIYCCTFCAVGELAGTLGANKYSHCCLSFVITQVFAMPGFAAHGAYLVGQIREQRGIEVWYMYLSSLLLG